MKKFYFLRLLGLHVWARGLFFTLQLWAPCAKLTDQMSLIYTTKKKKRPQDLEKRNILTKNSKKFINNCWSKNIPFKKRVFVFSYYIIFVYEAYLNLTNAALFKLFHSRSHFDWEIFRDPKLIIWNKQTWKKNYFKANLC